MDAELPTYFRQMMALSRHARNVFLLAVLICGVLALNDTLLGSRTAGQLRVVRSCFGPLLLWALTAVVHAFHLMARANAGIAQRADGILAAEQAKARQQLARIRARLSAQTLRQSE
jgi:hypothetical protein